MKKAHDWILVGMVKRIHGQKGELLIKPLTDRVEERFREGSQLFMSRKGEDSPSPVIVATSRMADRGPLIRLEGFDTREDAWPLFGANLFIRSSQLAELEPGRYYAFQLEGCAVYQGDRRAGVVTALIEPPRGNPYLAVDPGGERPPVHIPFVSKVVTQVDLERQRIDIAEGFLGAD